MGTRDRYAKYFTVSISIGKENSALDKQKSSACGGNVLSLFQKLRKLVFESFDESSIHTTRTQQMILTVMADGKTFSMSELARLISTSNEQATRAVSQLVKMELIERSLNESNHRIVNIKLTEKALEFMGEIRELAVKKLSAELFGTEKPDKKKLSHVVSLLKDLDAATTGIND